LTTPAPAAQLRLREDDDHHEERRWKNRFRVSYRGLDAASLALGRLDHLETGSRPASLRVNHAVKDAEGAARNP